MWRKEWERGGTRRCRFGVKARIGSAEKATDAFSKENYEKIFRHKPHDAKEKDFFEGVRFLHMALQFFRNEKAHTLAQSFDENRAMQYLTLANLAYVLISENKE